MKKYEKGRGSAGPEPGISNYESIVELLEDIGVTEEYACEELESIQNEMDIVYSEDEERDAHSKKKYEEMKDGNPAGAAFLRNRFDGVSFDYDGERSALDMAIENYLEEGDARDNPYSYGGAVKMIEEYGKMEEYRQEYLEAVEGAVKSFFEQTDSGSLSLTGILHDPEDLELDFSQKYTEVYRKLMEVGEERQSPEIFASAYMMADELSEAKGSDERIFSDVSDTEIYGLEMMKNRSYERMVESLSESLVEYIGQRRWIENNLGLEVPDPYSLEIDLSESGRLKPAGQN